MNESKKPNKPIIKRKATGRVFWLIKNEEGLWEEYPCKQKGVDQPQIQVQQVLEDGPVVMEWEDVFKTEIPRDDTISEEDLFWLKESVKAVEDMVQADKEGRDWRPLMETFLVNWNRFKN